MADKCVKWVLLDNKCTIFVECFEREVVRKKALFDDKVKERNIKKNDLVLRYKNEFDTRFDKKFIPRWKGPFVVKEVYS